MLLLLLVVVVVVVVCVWWWWGGNKKKGLGSAYFGNGETRGAPRQSIQSWKGLPPPKSGEVWWTFQYVFLQV